MLAPYIEAIMSFVVMSIGNDLAQDSEMDSVCTSDMIVVALGK